MKAKQKFSVAVSTLLPALALVGYLSLAPAKVQAQLGDCPPGEIYAGGHGTGCATGAGLPNVPIGQSGLFIFCPNQDGQLGAPNPGTCESGQCVQCEY